MSDRLGRKQRQDSCITNCAWEIIFILLGYFTIFHLSDLELESSHSLSSSSQQSCSLLFHATAPSPAAYIFQVQSSPFALSCLWTVLHKHMTLKSAGFKVQGSRFKVQKTQNLTRTMISFFLERTCHPYSDRTAITSQPRSLHRYRFPST